MRLVSQIADNINDKTPAQVAEQWAREAWDAPRRVEQTELVEGKMLAIDFKLADGRNRYRCEYDQEQKVYKISAHA